MSPCFQRRPRDRETGDPEHPGQSCTVVFVIRTSGIQIKDVLGDPSPPQVVVVSGNPPDSFSPGVEVTVSEDEEGEGLLLTCSATGRWGIQSSI